MKELLNTGQVLGRSEMKKIMAGSDCNLYKCCYDSGCNETCKHCEGGQGCYCGVGGTLTPCCW